MEPLATREVSENRDILNELGVMMRVSMFKRKDLRPSDRGADTIDRLIRENPSRSRFLFRRGYLVTTKQLSLGGYPFFDNWTKTSLGALADGRAIELYGHSDLTTHVKYTDEQQIFTIIGHAYDPFRAEFKEELILENLAVAFRKGEEHFYREVSGLTGIHVIIVNDNGRLIIVQDCAGMKSCYYLDSESTIVLTSHPQLAADLFDLAPEPHAQDLMSRWFFSLSGRSLPGDLSPFAGLRRLGPNLALKYGKYFDLERFYPTEPHRELKSHEFDSAINEIVDVISTNIGLCAKKWRRPAISLSGGVDSRVTLACARPFEEKFDRFSFHSKSAEFGDAQAARDICNHLGLSHQTYPIPQESSEIPDFEAIKSIILHNSSYMGMPGEHELRKFVTLSSVTDFDIELKSWISEIGRAMWGRRLGVNLPERLRSRHFSIFQTRYIGAPALLAKSDNASKDFLQRSSLVDPPFNYEHADFFYWEYRWGSWGAGAKTMQDIFGWDVTMPMNNRRLMDMFLQFPHELRKNDSVHLKIVERANPKLAYFPLVKNDYSGSRRVLLERVYWLTHGRLWSKI